MFKKSPFTEDQIAAHVEKAEMAHKGITDLGTVVAINTEFTLEPGPNGATTMFGTIMAEISHLVATQKIMELYDPDNHNVIAAGKTILSASQLGHSFSIILPVAINTYIASPVPAMESHKINPEMLNEILGPDLAGQLTDKISDMLGLSQEESQEINTEPPVVGL